MNTINAIWLIVALAIMLPVGSASAQSDDVSVVSAFLEANGTRERYSRMLAGQVDAANQAFYRNLGGKLENQSLEGPQKDRAMQLMRRNFNSFTEKLQTYVAEKCSWDWALHEVFIPLYVKEFTVKEMKEAIAFYNSDVGRKLVAAGPQLEIESLGGFERARAGDIQALIREEVRVRLKSIVTEVRGE